MPKVKSGHQEEASEEPKAAGRKEGKRPQRLGRNKRREVSSNVSGKGKDEGGGN